MSRKDYELIARVIRAQPCTTKADRHRKLGLALTFATELAATNPRFDRERFLKACGVDS